MFVILRNQEMWKPDTFFTILNKRNQVVHFKFCVTEKKNDPLMFLSVGLNAFYPCVSFIGYNVKHFLPIIAFVHVVWMILRNLKYKWTILCNNGIFGRILFRFNFNFMFFWVFQIKVRASSKILCLFGFSQLVFRRARIEKFTKSKFCCFEE